MYEIKKGDIVKKKNYSDNILFIVKDIININNMPIEAVLKGVTLRIEESVKVQDIEVVKQDIVEKQTEEFEKSIDKRAATILNRFVESDYNSKVIKAKILHLDR